MFLYSLPAAPRLPRLRPQHLTLLYLLLGLVADMLCDWWIVHRIHPDRQLPALVASEVLAFVLSGAALYLLAQEMRRRLVDATAAAAGLEATARLTAGHLGELLAMLPEPIVISQHERIVYANRAACTLFESGSGSSLLGLSLMDRMAPQCREQAIERMRRTAVEGWRDDRFIPRTMLRLDGRPLEAMVGISPVQWCNQPAVLHVIRDVGEIIAAQRASELAQRELAALSRSLIEVQERERRSIARELHDEIGQCLSAIRVQFAKLQRRVTDPAKHEMITAASAMTERTLGRVRSLSLLLHPPQLDTLGLEAALQWHIDELSALHDVQVTLDAQGLPKRLHPDLSIAAYRITQESLSNALRHARARRIDVQLRATEDGLRLDIVDDGVGFRVDQVRERHRTPSLGLVGMTERARLLGGDLTVRSAPGIGTRIAAQLPWR
jgi:PAS domain S-box-containing protein